VSSIVTIPICRRSSNFRVIPSLPVETEFDARDATVTAVRDAFHFDGAS